MRFQIRRIATALAAFAVPGLLSLTVCAQEKGFDTSGNGMLFGDYYIREVALTNVAADGEIGVALSATGIVTFGTQGTYSFTGLIMNSTTRDRQPTTQTIAGHFGVAANGLLQMDSLLSVTSGTPDLLNGGVGIAGPNAFSATTTNSANFDMIVGIPLATDVSAANLQGVYNYVYLNFQEGHADLVRNAWFALNTLGNGKAAFNTPVTGFAANISPNDNHVFQESDGTVTYSLNDDDGGSLNFALATDPRTKLLQGKKAFRMSPDGSIMIGGATDGFDILIGMPPASDDDNTFIENFYYMIGLEEDATLVANQVESFDSYAGSISATQSGFAISHKRLNTMTAPFQDLTSQITFTVASDGTFQPAGSTMMYGLGSNSLLMMGHGSNGRYGISLGLEQQFTRNTNIFLHPLGVVNSASYAPITNPIAPLEIVLLFGQNFCKGTVNAPNLPLPTTLNNVQVFFNGIPAPLFAVSPTLITALVPLRVSPVYGLKWATVQVVSSSIASNAVTVAVTKTAPGVYAAGQGGVGPVAALHGNSVLIDDAHPATTGETVELFLTGLGPVTPGVGEGAPGLPPPNASLADQKPTVLIDGIPSPNVPYAGLAPGLAGLFQVNAEIPADTSSGRVNVSIVTSDGTTMQTMIAVQATH